MKWQGLTEEERHKFHRYIKKPIPISAKILDAPMDVETLEGTIHGKKGDYLVIGTVGEKWVVRKDIFETTYEKARPTEAECF